MRIASLIPSGTDLAAALGLGEHLVAVSHECDHDVAAGRPVVTSSILTSDLAPAEVDRQVSEAQAAGESLYRTDAATLKRLAPDLVLTQDVCDVCAVHVGTVSCDLPPGAELVLLSATSIEGLDADLRRVAKAAGVDDRADEVVADLHRRLDAVRARVADRPIRRVVALEWGDPPFLGGHWVPELVALAGGDHLLNGPAQPSTRASWPAVSAAEPDVVVFMPCGYGLQAAAQEAEGLELQGFGGELWATDATSLFSRCTPAAVAAAAETLAGILHGDPAPDPALAVRIR